MKRRISSILSIAIIISLLGGAEPVMAANPTQADKTTQTAEQEPTNGGKNSSGTVTNSDGITISKKIESTGIENYFDVTLTVKETEKINETSTDVVIVMDISNTMNSDTDNLPPDVSKGETSRLTEAKLATQRFIERYYQAPYLSSVRNLGLVTFNSDANIRIDLQQVNAPMINTVAGITAPGFDSNRRFTNIEGGLRLANQMLANSNSKYKYVILLTDGFPTTYTEKITGGGRTYQGKDAYTLYDSYTNQTCIGTSYSDTAAIKARQTAVNMKNAGIDIVTIGIDVGSQTIQQYHNQGVSGGYSIVERGKNVHPNGYEIGKANDKAGYISWLTNKIGGGKNITDSYYSYNSNKIDDLVGYFDDILQTIKNTHSQAMGSAAVVDPMGEYAEFIGFYNKNGVLQTQGKSLTGSYGENKENTASYAGSASKNAIDWDLDKSGYKVEVKRENVNGQQQITEYYYTYTLKYRVRLENESAGFVENKFTYTNDGATLTYDDPEGEEPKDPTDDDTTMEFPDPKVKGFLGELTFKKTNSAGNGLRGAEFSLSHDANCTVCKQSKDVSNNTVHVHTQKVTSDANGNVKFTGIPSGHDYILKETKAPTGYKPNSTSYKVKIAYDEVTWNGPANKQIVNEVLDPVKYTIKGSKTLTGNIPQNAKFVFVLKDASGKELDRVEQTGNGEFSFDERTYTSAGTYLYEVVEIKGNDEGIIYDTSVYHVTVTVGANSANTAYEVKDVVVKNHTTGAVSSDDKANFVNKAREAAAVPLQAEKTLSGRLLKEGDFSFELKDDAGTVLQTKTNDQHGMVYFDALTFEESGTYTYTITEKAVDPSWKNANMNLIFDSSVYTVTINVAVPQGDGAYTANVTYSKAGNNLIGHPVFNNELKDVGKAGFSFQKADYDDGKALEGVEFTLTHISHDNCQYPAGEPTSFDAISDSNGIVSFSDIPSGHSYILKELPTSGNTVHVDGTDYILAVDRHVEIQYGVVTIDGIEVDTTHVDGTDSNKDYILYNVSKEGTRAQFEVKKELPGAPQIFPNTFQAVITETNSSWETKPNGYTETVYNTNVVTGQTAESKFIFDPVFFKAVGDYYFTISEVDGNDNGIIYDKKVYYVKVTVTDVDGNNELEIQDGNIIITDGTNSVEQSALVFNNALRKPTSLTLNANKSMLVSGSDGIKEKFTFVLKDANGDVLQEKVNEDASGNITAGVVFDPLTFDVVTEEGKPHVYTIEEVAGSVQGMVYDKTVYTVEVAVTAPDDKDSYVATPSFKKGSESYTGTPVFTNTYRAFLVLTKTDKEGTLLEGAEFTLIHDAGNCSCQMTIEDKTAVSRSTGTGTNQDTGNLIFSDIQSGHKYILRETAAPEGYAAAPEHIVEVRQGIAYIYDTNGKPTSLTDEYKTHTIINYDEAKVLVEGEKILAGRSWTDEDEFTFVLTDDKWTELDRKSVDKEEPFFDFDYLVYDEQAVDKDASNGPWTKDYTYYVYEEIPSGVDENNLKDGITYDNTVYKVNVEVKVTGHHEISAQIKSIDKGTREQGAFVPNPPSNDPSVQAETSGILFTNTYGTEPITVELMGTKHLDGRPIVPQEFQFGIYGANENWETNPVPINIVTNDQDGNFVYNTRTYTSVGTYRYVIREIDNMMGGVTYDNRPIYLTYEVKDTGKGHLILTAYAKKGESYANTADATLLYEYTSNEEFKDEYRNVLKDTIKFENDYEVDPDSSVDVPFSANKILKGRKLKAGDFVFSLYEADEHFNEGVMLKSVENALDGTVDLGRIQYKKEDIGQHYYIMKEDAGTRSRMKYDDTVYQITVTISDNQQGGLAADMKIVAVKNEVAEDVDIITFKNVYKSDDDDEDPTPTTPPTPTKVESADSGDDTNLFLPIAMLIAALAGIAGWLFMRKREED